MNNDQLNADKIDVKDTINMELSSGIAIKKWTIPKKLLICQFQQ